MRNYYHEYFCENLPLKQYSIQCTNFQFEEQTWQDTQTALSRVFFARKIYLGPNILSVIQETNEIQF